MRKKTVRGKFVIGRLVSKTDRLRRGAVRVCLASLHFSKSQTLAALIARVPFAIRLDASSFFLRRLAGGWLQKANEKTFPSE